MANPFDQFDTSQGIPTKGPDPSLPAQRRKASNEAAASDYKPAMTAEELRALQLRNAELEAKILEAGKDEVKEAKKLSSKEFQDRLKLDNIRSAIDDARMIIRSGKGAGWGSLLSSMPESAALELASAMDTIKANLSFDRLQEMRDNSATGGALGSVTENELKLLGSVVASINQGQSPETLLRNLDRVEQHYVRSQIGLNGVDLNSDEGKALYEAVLPPKPVIPQGPQGTPQIGIQERFSTEADKRFGAMAQSAFDRGASFQELDALAKQYGYPGYGDTNLQEAIRYRDKGGSGASISAPESGFRDPSITERAFQEVAASPFGTYMGQAANALTLGGLDEIGGIAAGDTIGEAFSGTGVNTAEADLRKRLSAEANPNAGLAGMLSGGFIGAGMGGALTGVGKGATKALSGRALAGDALYGGAFGAGEDNQHRVRGGMFGAGAGMAGGALGRGAFNTAGSALTGVTDPYVRTLNERGVRMTIPQMAGGGLKSYEDRLAGFQGIGDKINTKRTRGMEDFNRAAFDEGTEAVGMTTGGVVGEPGVDLLRQITPQAYDKALGGVTVMADEPFQAGIGAQLLKARGLPAIGDQASYNLERSIAPFIGEGGEISGRNIQNITQELQRRAGRFDKSTDAVGPDAADILRGASGDLESLVNRQAPDVMPDFLAANRTYRLGKVIEDAVSKGINTGGMFTPAQLGQSARTSAKKYGNNAATTDRPFYELQRAGQEVLPANIPDSGTAGRASSSWRDLARNVANAPLYSETVENIARPLMLNRNGIMINAGEVAKAKARLGGMFGTPYAISYTQ